MGEDDPVAALVAQRVAELKATRTGTVPVPSDKPARIEVPIITESDEEISDEVSEDIQELGPIDESEGREIPAPVPAAIGASPPPPPPRSRMVALMSVPLLLLVLGLAGYLMMRSGAHPETPLEDAVQTSVPSNEPLTPEAPLPPPVDEPVAQDSSTAAIEERASAPLVDRAKSNEGTTRSDESQRSDNSDSERTASGRFEAMKRADASRTRRQEQNQARNRDRNNRTTRPRVVDDEEFEQPPVSSIESIMTGIPTERPRRQRRWEVLEEDELRRERRIRRINRRNRQRDQLF